MTDEFISESDDTYWGELSEKVNDTADFLSAEESQNFLDNVLSEDEAVNKVLAAEKEPYLDGDLKDLLHQYRKSV